MPLGTPAFFIPGNGFPCCKRQFADPAKLFENLKSKQGANRFYNPNLKNQHSRDKLVAWVCKFTAHFEYKSITKHLAVCYIDAVLSMYDIDESQLVLLAYTAIQLAAKFEEPDSQVPSIDSAVNILRGRFTAEHIIKCESFVFQVLGHQLNVKVPQVFTTLLCKAGIMCAEDFEGKVDDADMKRKIHEVEELVEFFIDLSLKSYEFYKFTSLTVAASAIACARKAKGFAPWRPEFRAITGLDECSLI